MDSVTKCFKFLFDSLNTDESTSLMTKTWGKFMNPCCIIQLLIWDPKAQHTAPRQRGEACENNLPQAKYCRKASGLFSILFRRLFSNTGTKCWNDLLLEILKSVMDKCRSKLQHVAKVTRNFTKALPGREPAHHLSTFSCQGTGTEKALRKDGTLLAESIKTWKIIIDRLLNLFV